MSHYLKSLIKNVLFTKIQRQVIIVAADFCDERAKVNIIQIAKHANTLNYAQLFFVQLRTSFQA